MGTKVMADTNEKRKTLGFIARLILMMQRYGYPGTTQKLFFRLALHFPDLFLSVGHLLFGFLELLDRLVNLFA